MLHDAQYTIGFANFKSSSVKKTTLTQFREGMIGCYDGEAQSIVGVELRQHTATQEKNRLLKMGYM